MSEDAELQAIQQLLSALEPLDAEARGRVIEYVFRRLSLTSAGSSRGSTAAPPLPSPIDSGAASTTATPPPGGIVDIRTFAAEKQPSSQMEKTVFVAYYLSELAPEAERKTELSGGDLTKYQKQADLGAPTNTRQALFRARDAGYLESAGHGKYKLNAVGYNLVAHSLPSVKTASRSPVTRTTRKRKTTRKKTKRKSSTRKKSTKKR